MFPRVRRLGRQRWLWVPLVVVAGAVLFGLALHQDRDGNAPDAAAVGRRLLDAPVGDYVPSSKQVNGPLARGGADAATVVPTSALHDVLQRHAWESAYSRVWTHGADFQSAVGFRFDDVEGAQALVERVSQEVRDISSGAVFPLDGVIGVLAFTVPSRQPGQKASVFCQGALIVDGRDAFQLLECSAAPPSLATLAEMARRQVARLTS